MNNLVDIEREVWDRIQAATRSHNGALLAHLGVLADEIENKKKDWVDRLAKEPWLNGARHVGVTASAASASKPTSFGDYTRRPVRGFQFDGNEVPVTTYKDLLVRLANLLRAKYGEDFDRRVITLGGRKRRYFSEDPRQLKYAHKLDTGELFVETNLNANLIVKICYEIVRALGLDEEKLKIR